MALEMKKRPRAPLDVAVRKDDWWIKPLLTVIGLGLFGLYATARAFENAHYEVGPYLSPFYSPHVPLKWEIAGWAVSPALYILVFPLAFRLTCYYYRQAYYRSFFWDPPACAVPEPKARRHYHGEKTFPLVMQNLHRYALYVALLFLVLLWYDALKAFFFENGFGVGVGSLIMLANVVLLSGYTFGCHSLRHLVGGRMDCFTCPMNDHKVQEQKLRPAHRVWMTVTRFNQNHMQWAWTSLFGVMLTDFYIRMVASGVIRDFRFF